ncbi:tRNA-dihydrouridine synthase 2 [Knufia obscura]|uniref:tRNA-dihydrouridine synthase 2 n=1 Tax=Knufia obscura TaxID=1635080 RepID=A0ABR0RIR8_9EURO|nr:tRNA-dihydrouridine synthase 2 [Knufia obscura]
MSTNIAAGNGSNTPNTTPAPSQSPTSNVSRPASPATVPHVPIPRRGVGYRGKVVLAPMVRSGELPSRLLALYYKADLVWGPETVDRSMIGTIQRTNSRTGCIEWSRPQNKHANSLVTEDGEKENVIYRIDSKRESDRLVFQIGTNSPERAVAAADLVAPYCVAIDVNAGCPKSFSTDGGMGAALLTEQNGDLLARILTALVNEVGQKHEIGISVKIRLLSTPEETSALVHKLCKTGITGLTIHCRTRPMRPRERAIREQLRMIGEICHSHGVACLMNGDVASRDEAVRLAQEYGVDGGMIATAAEANSSVFLSESEGGKKHWREVVTQYLRFALEVENKFGNTKFLLSQLMPGKEAIYQRVSQCRSYTAILQALELNNDVTMSEMAKNVDSLLHLDEPKVSKSDVKKANKAANRAKHEANIARKKRAAEEFMQAQQHKRERRTSPLREQTEARGRSPERKAEIAADNAGFEGVGQGALQVAV